MVKLIPIFHLTPETDWERTSLKKYVDMLDTHVKGLMDEVRRVKREQGGST